MRLLLLPTISRQQKCLPLVEMTINDLLHQYGIMAMKHTTDFFIYAVNRIKVYNTKLLML